VKYKKKTKSALWTRVPGAEPVRGSGLRKDGKGLTWRVKPRRLTKATALYELLRRDYLRNARCAKCGSNRYLCVHHKRGRLGKLLTETKHWVALCFDCHRWVHDNPEWARKSGLLAEKGCWNK